MTKKEKRQYLLENGWWCHYHPDCWFESSKDNLYVDNNGKIKGFRPIEKGISLEEAYQKLITQNIKTMEYLSLYDYLKSPAGIELGAEVKKYADANDIPTKTREVSNPKYQGKVTLYPKTFLELYFRKPPEIENEEYFDDLPF